MPTVGLGECLCVEQFGSKVAIHDVGGGREFRSLWGDLYKKVSRHHRRAGHRVPARRMVRHPPRFQVLAIGLRLWLGERLRTRKRAFPRRLLVKPYAHTCCCSLPGLQVHGIIFVLDASDEARFAEAKHELAVVADSPAALGKPILMSASPRPLCTRHRAPFAPGRCGAGRAGCAWWFCRGPWTRPTCVPLPHALLLASLVPILRAAEC